MHSQLGSNAKHPARRRRAAALRGDAGGAAARAAGGRAAPAGSGPRAAILPKFSETRFLSVPAPIVRLSIRVTSGSAFIRDLQNDAL